MLACLETLRDDVRLRSLLGAYRQFQVERPAAEWHDRVMEIPKVDADRLSRLHGYALASGWIDTRVDRASFTASGQIVNCYRLTREGAAALRVIDEDLEDVDAI